MYQHHIDSIENLKKYFCDKEDVIALILGGSVVKVCERPDSDLDAMVVLTDESYEKKKEQNATAETIGDIVSHIPIFQVAEKEEKMLSFYSDFWLNWEEGLPFLRKWRMVIFMYEKAATG